jgi:hypothetical protein
MAFLSSSKNGYYPESKTYVRTPILQKSHSFPYLSPFKISGATYPGVPQVVLAS